MDLALNNLQNLICQKTQTNKQIMNGDKESRRDLMIMMMICVGITITQGIQEKL